jgi:RimJ/RimL family protein N-acetyltransferase
VTATAIPEFLVVAEADGYRIRHKLPADIPEDYAWRKDEGLARYDGRPPLDMPYAEFEQQMAQEVRFASPSRQGFSIVAPDGTHVGNCMFYNVGLSRDSAELGIMLASPALWGRGLGRALMVAFVRYLWASHPFRVLVLHTLEWNERAIRSFQRAGFEETARVLRDGEWLRRMEARREWWLLWDAEGRFARRERNSAPGDASATPEA